MFLYFHRDHSTRLLVAARICACDELQYPAHSCHISARENALNWLACLHSAVDDIEPKPVALRVISAELVT